MQKSNLDVLKVRGIFRPILQIRGWAFKENFYVELHSGKKLIKKMTPNTIRDDINFIMNVEDKKVKYGYDYEIKLPLNSRKISVYLVSKNNKKLLDQFPNTLLFRIYKAFSEIFNKIYQKISGFIDLFFRAIKFLWREYHFLIPPKKLAKYFKIFIAKVRNNQYEFQEYNNPEVKKEYHKWIKKYEKESPIEELEYNPLISIVMPVYNVESKYLTECIESVLNQTYQNFEICIADDCSTNKDTLDCLKKYENNPKIKIKYREKNGHISEATNSAIELATGEFIGLLDNDDLLKENALYENVKILNKNKNLDLIYSDEDKYDLKHERALPVFKPDWSPDTLMSHNYICHFALIRKTIIDKIGGFRKGVEGSQDFDLFLRISEVTNKIHHIPMILYHWRMIPTSTSMNIESKSYVTDRGIRVLEDALKRRNLKGKVVRHDSHTFYSIKYDCPKNKKTTIIINYKSTIYNLLMCLREIYKNTDSYFDIIILNYKKENIDDKIKTYSEKNKIEVIKVNNDFAKVMNKIVSETNSKFIAFLDDNCETRTKNWLDTMIGHASQKHIGAVGSKITLGTTQILHGGMILGLRNSVAFNSNVGKQFFDSGTMFRMLVPSNFSCVSGACLVFEKKKLKKFDENVNIKYWDINLCLDLLDKGYYNVLLPEVVINKSRLTNIYQNEKTILKIEDEKNYMMKKWKQLINNDPFYNINYDKNNEFMLKK